ncbi:MAG: hypothetical protein U9R75_05480 [Candidatus Thermoplasmatota archaeon]|nr:hypothetical protein [Candidatus Thermoplasmatota archaeon]
MVITMGKISTDDNVQRFLNFLFRGNIVFTILMTIACVFLFILGISSTQLLGALLFLSMIYLLMMATWGNEVRTEIAGKIEK